MPKSFAFTGLREKIQILGKENLDEMLHALASGIIEGGGNCTVRIYLEDLTKGALSCAHATGSDKAAIEAITFPIIAADILISSAFVSQQIYEIRSVDRLTGFELEFVERFDIVSSTLFPLTSNGKSLLRQ